MPEADSPSASDWNRARHRFAVLTAGAAFLLLGAGGLVTSHGVGMAVPDWPNTYGYNMFFFPVSRWVSGIFYEHTHRLIASLVGLLTAILAIWFYGRNARPFLRWTGMALLIFGPAIAALAPKHGADAIVVTVTGLASFGASLVWPSGPPAPVWLRRLGLVAFFAVLGQGILGGLRVVLLKDQIGIFHATLAQLFFALVCAIAVLTRSPKSEARNPKEGRSPKSEIPAVDGIRTSAFGLLSDFGFRPSDLSVVRRACIFATVLIFFQLVLGATMRHQHAGLAIPDFPLAYGKVWPAMDPASVARYNQHRIEVTDANPITAFQIALQMVHRIMALMILGAVGFYAWTARRRLGTGWLTRLSLVWLGLILVQALLGAATIWSNKAADVATAHVLTGALALALGVIQCILTYSLTSVVELPRAAAERLTTEKCNWQTAT